MSLRAPAPRARGGVTLIEIMIAMAVLGLVMTAALTLYLPSLGRFSAADAAYDAQRHALAGVKMLAADVKDTRFGLFVSANSGADAPAVFIPTPRDAVGAYHVKSDDQPDWQGWIAYWATPEPSPAVGLQLHRAFVPGRPEDDPVPKTVSGGKVVAGGLSGLRLLAGQTPTEVKPHPGGIALFTDLTSSAYTSGGRGRIRIVVDTVRVLHDQNTTFQGDKTVDIAY